MFQKMIPLFGFLAAVGGHQTYACARYLGDGKILYQGLAKVTHFNINSMMEPAVSPRGDMMATGSSKNRSIVDVARILGTKTVSVRRLTHDKNLAIVGASFSRNSKVVATVTNEQEQVFVWNVESGDLIRQFSPKAMKVSNWALSPDGSKIVLTAAKPNLLVVYLDLSTGTTLEKTYLDLVSEKDSPFLVNIAFTSNTTFILGFDRFAPREFRIDSDGITRTRVLRDQQGTSLLSLRPKLDPDWNLVDYSGWVTTPGSRWLVAFGSASITTEKIVFPNGTTRTNSNLTYHVELWDLNKGTFVRSLSEVPSFRYPTQEGTDLQPRNAREALAELLDPDSEVSRSMRNPYVMGTVSTVNGREVAALGTISFGGSDYVSIFDLETGTIIREVSPSMGCINSIGLQESGIVVSSRGDKSVRRWQLREQTH